MLYSLRIKSSLEPTTNGANDEVTIELEPDDTNYLFDEMPLNISDDDLNSVVQYQVLPTKNSARAYHWVNKKADTPNKGQPFYNAGRASLTSLKLGFPM